jgi:hypothetical protein
MTIIYYHYGAPVFSTLSILSYLQRTMNTVEILFDSEPLHLDPADPIDSLNLDNYVTTVTNVSSDDPERLLQYIDYISENTIRLWYDGPLVKDGQYQIEISDIENTLGNQIFPNPTTISFEAFDREKGSLENAQPTSISMDLTNPQTPSTAGQQQSLGTFQIDDKGDFINDSGRTSLKKRIMRRISTKKGGFFHLADYGLKIGEGELITPTKLRKLQVDAENQIKREPEVIALRVVVEQIFPGIVKMLVKVQDNLGTFDMTKDIDLTESSF